LPVAFEGYNEFIKKPLELNDPRSFTLVQKLLSQTPEFNRSPWTGIIKTLSGITISRGEALQHWKKILAHKRRLENALRRPVGIKTAIVDFYDLSEIATDPQVETDTAEATAAAHPPVREPAYTPVVAPGYHQDRLKEEMQRAKRYKHALSAIMLDVDLAAIKATTPINEVRDQALTVIDTMIHKAIRNVDIRARHSDNLFFIILPNTNKREAQELAGRLLKKISTRMQRLPGMNTPVPLKAAVGQSGNRNDTSAEFIKRLEHLVVSCKNDKADAVLLLD
jgi:diguanylate cyclase (GGDEF)-like protein